MPFDPCPGREVRQAQAYPGHQQHRQHAHDAEAGPPAQHLAQQGSRRDSQRQRQRRADHRNRDRLALLRRRHHARGIACQQRPQQPCRHAGAEARQHRQHKVRRERGDRVGQREAGDRGQQQRPSAHALGGGGQRDRGDHRAQCVDADGLADPGLRHRQPLRHLRQQAGRQRLGEDGDEPCQGQRQQRRQRQAVVRTGLHRAPPMPAYTASRTSATKRPDMPSYKVLVKATTLNRCGLSTNHECP